MRVEEQWKMKLKGYGRGRNSKDRGEDRQWKEKRWRRRGKNRSNDEGMEDVEMRRREWER